MSDPGTTADTLDKEQIDQLHAATLQVSSNCFELKKLCATVIVAAGTLIALLSNRELNQAIFVGGLVVVAVFWCADAQSYYIQVKLRARMKELLRDRVKRVPELSSYASDGVGLPVEDQPAHWHRVLHAFFNASMLYYFLVAFVVLTAWAAYASGLIE
ncbi:MAG TPA: hypothetical protein VMF51_16445 [Nocardioides sp.]|uniref:hypothetical protein n=1 Tax=Nocardioides sp. TaxID=35761 RepID=UPI002C703394|nr:hypothetical protein [Nocardioides sp.]HTW16726.1 hypothetical protein [Nocardioides sp.]